MQPFSVIKNFRKIEKDQLTNDSNESPKLQKKINNQYPRDQPKHLFMDKEFESAQEFLL